MSNNPWPFVTVALVSLGFLANSMAQQDNNFAEPYAPGSTGPTAKLKFGDDFPPDATSEKRADLELPQVKFGDPSEDTKRETRGGSYWNPNPPPQSAPTNRFGNPAATDAKSARNAEPVRLGAVTGTTNSNSESIYGGGSATKNSVLGSPSGNRGSDATAVEPGTRFGSANQTGNNSVPGWGNGPGANSSEFDQRSLERTELAERQNVAENPWDRRSKPIRERLPANNVDPRNQLIDLRNTPAQIRPAQTRPVTPSANDPTHDAGIIVELPQFGESGVRRGRGFRSNQSTRADARGTRSLDDAPAPAGSGNSQIRTSQVGFGTGPSSKTFSDNNLERTAEKTKLDEHFKPVDGFEDEVTDPSSTITEGRKLPLWSTMALFASLAANLFFGWIAWDTHSRYQDFVEEMSESDSRRERRSRRMRDEPATRASSTLRTREQDEAEFLRGGIEV